jgi:RimJ/RimL family protein N-acetyltransferase
LEHDLSFRGHAHTLRPVALADAPFIVSLRGTAGRFLNRGAASDAEQRAWIERYFTRADDYYFVVERNADGKPEGLVGIYDVDRDQRAAEWGRFVLRPGSRAAVEAALLIYRCGFDCLDLDRVYCRTLAENAQVVAFHDSCGLARTVAPMLIQHNGEALAAIEHVLHRDEWPGVHARLERLAARLAKPLGPAVKPERQGCL